MAVNLSPVGGVAAQFFDNSGQVLTGGKLYTYLAGTTTPAATYTTNSGLTANSNPIVLNAAGRVADSGEIWLTDGINYKFVLKDSNDVQIAVWDNISGINSNFVNYTLQEQTFTATQGQTVFTLTGGLQYSPATNNLAVYVNGSKQVAGTNYLETSSTVFTFLTGLNVGDVVDAFTAIPVATNVISSNNVSYNQGSTGAVTTNVQAKLAQTVSVKDFGAKGDGTTDDTSSIQAALTYLGVNGGRLYFPTGTYLISSTLTASATTYKELIIYGDGGASVVNAPMNAPIFNITSNNVHIENMEFNGSQANYATYTNSTLFVGSNTLGTFLNLNLKYFRAGINIQNTSMASIERCHISNCVYGISCVIVGGAVPFINLVNISNSYVEYCVTGIAAQAWYACNIYNTVFQQCGNFGGILTNVVSCTFNAVWCEANTNGDFAFTDSTPNLINCRFSASNSTTYTYTSGWGALAKTRGQIAAGQEYSAYYNIDAYNSSTLLYNTIATITNKNATSQVQITNPTYTGNTQVWNFNPNSLVNTPFGSDGLLNLTTNSTTAQINLNLANTAYPNGQSVLAFSNYNGGNGYCPKLIGSGNQILFQGFDSNGYTGYGSFAPQTDNVATLGSAGNRWTTVYATTGTINTSDATQKQQGRSLSDAEKAVAIKIKAGLKAFKWNDDVEAKGDKARWHFGVYAQEVKSAFESEGLVAEEYGVFCSDKFENGNIQLGVRYDELLAFIIASL